MASVSVGKRDTERDRAEGRPATWRVRWRDPEGRSKSKTFTRKTDADKFAVELERELNRGSYIDPGSAKMTVGELAETWRAGQVQLKPSTAARYDASLRNQILPRWEKVPLGKVTHGEVQAWVASLSKSGLAPRSVVKAHVVLARVLDLAVKDRRLSVNPARGVELPRAEQKAKRFLTAEQVADLADACEEQAAGTGLIVTTLAYTGLRVGELAALRVSDFDALRKRLHVRRSVTDVDGHMVFSSPKTHAHREVPIPRFLVDQLAAHLAATGRKGDELLFTSPEGSVLRNNNFRRRGFDAGAAEVGLDGLTPHELRHAAASLAVASGADVKAVQRMLGHASAAMTLDVYSTLFEDGLDAVAERMDEIASKAAQARASRSGGRR